MYKEIKIYFYCFFSPVYTNLVTPKEGKMEKLLALIIALAGVVAIVFLSSVWYGYVLTILWAWFIVPVFKLPILSIPVAIGIALIVRYLTHKGTKKEEINLKFLSMEFFNPLAVLFIGWIVSHFL